MKKNLIKDHKEINLYEAQNRLLDILEYFHNFCEKHDLKYYIFFGTLLGAYRSHDVIPWDDDIDVIMPRKDYDKFCELQHELQSPYSLLNISNYDKCEVSYGRLVDNNFLYFKDGWKCTAHNNHHLYIDLFVLEEAPLYEKDARSFLKATKFDFFVLKYKYNFYEPNLKSKILKPIIRFFLLPFKFPKIHKNIRRKFQKYCSNRTSDKFIIPENCPQGYLRTFEKRMFLEQSVLEMRGRKFCAPCFVDEILTQRYGPTFMTPLPPEEREPKKEFYVKENS